MMIVRPIIIGFCGEKGSGKDFVADIVYRYFRNQWAEVEKHAFADPFKVFCRDALGISHKLLWGNDDDKNTLTRFKWKDIPIKLDKPNFDPVFISVREIMQLVGTSLGRDI